MKNKMKEFLTTKTMIVLAAILLAQIGQKSVYGQYYNATSQQTQSIRVVRLYTLETIKTVPNIVFSSGGRSISRPVTYYLVLRSDGKFEYLEEDSSSGSELKGFGQYKIEGNRLSVQWANAAIESWQFSGGLIYNNGQEVEIKGDRYKDSSAKLTYSPRTDLPNMDAGVRVGEGDFLGEWRGSSSLGDTLALSFYQENSYDCATITLNGKQIAGKKVFYGPRGRSASFELSFANPPYIWLDITVFNELDLQAFSLDAIVKFNHKDEMVLRLAGNGKPRPSNFNGADVFVMKRVTKASSSQPFKPEALNGLDRRIDTKIVSGWAWMLVGTWKGKADNQDCTLVIERAEGDAFWGTLNELVSGAKIAIVGNIDFARNVISFDETKIISINKNEDWNLGTNSGSVSSNWEKMSGTGKDKDHSYKWSYVKIQENKYPGR